MFDRSDPLVLRYRTELLRRYPTLRAAAAFSTLEQVYVALLAATVVLAAAAVVVAVRVPAAAGVALLVLATAGAVAMVAVGRLATGARRRRRVWENAGLLALVATRDGQGVADRTVARCRGDLGQVVTLLRG